MSQLLLPAAVRSLQWQRRRLLLSQYAEFNFVPGFPQTIYQEFYCDASGAVSASNLNGGSDTASPITDLAGTYKRGLGFGGTDQILASSGTPFANVVPGSYVGIKAAGGTGVLDYCAMVLAVNGGGTDIFVADGTVSTRSFGTRPADAASIDSRVGGRWLGPNAAVSFPFGSITGAATDASGNGLCCNFINAATYNITAAITHTLAGPSMFAGMSLTPRDGGRAIIDGGTSGASYVLLSMTNGSALSWLDAFVFQNNGASGSASGLVSSSASSTVFNNCIVNSIRGTGVEVASAKLYGSEVYNCNQSNTSSKAGVLSAASSSRIISCYIHDNTSSATYGVISTSAIETAIDDCIIENNGFVGATIVQGGNAGTCVFRNSDFYGNGSDGVVIQSSFDNSQNVIIENCNFVKNKGFGIGHTGGNTFSRRLGMIRNCGFGSGAFTNNMGLITDHCRGMRNSGCFVYSSPGHPYANPATGDFRLVHKQALGTGRGSFTQTGNSKSGSVAYPDVGSCQSRRPPRRVFPGGVGA